MSVVVKWYEVEYLIRRGYNVRIIAISPISGTEEMEFEIDYEPTIISEIYRILDDSEQPVITVKKDVDEWNDSEQILIYVPYGTDYKSIKELEQVAEKFGYNIDRFDIWGYELVIILEKGGVDD